MEKEKRIKLEHSRELSSTTCDTSDEISIDTGPKKRHHAPMSPNITLLEERNKIFGYGPPFLFSLPEPIKSPWKRSNSPNFRKVARPISGNALKRVEGKRRYNPSFEFSFPEEDTDDAGNSNNKKSKSEVRLGYHLVRTVNCAFDIITTILVVIFLCCTFLFFWMIGQDIENKAAENFQESHRSISECSKSYLDNRCTPGDRVPALEKVCSQWEMCMNRDPTVVSRTKIFAEVIGEFINTLLEQLSYKSMLFMMIIVFVTAIVLANFFITLFETIKTRNYPLRETPHAHPGMQTHSIASMQYHMSPGSPSTPQHSASKFYS